MKKLSKSAFIKAGQAINQYGRQLEKMIYAARYGNGSREAVILELGQFQNEDGGFGNGIESDFRMPYSSPMATSVGVRHLSGLDDIEASRVMISKAISYLEASYHQSRKGWFALPKEVNKFPHAPWWHYDEEKGMTIIDRNWGNPSAELIAYLYHYKEFVKDLDVDSLVMHAITLLEEKTEFNSDNELYGYIYLYEALPENLQKRLEAKLTKAIAQVVEYDESKWTEYVPRPFDFVRGIGKCRFGIESAAIEKSLDFHIEQLEAHGKIDPPWGESYYMGDLKPAYHEWIGVLTLKALLVLDRHGRL